MTVINSSRSNIGSSRNRPRSGGQTIVMPTGLNKDTRVISHKAKDKIISVQTRGGLLSRKVRL